jgi:hypothetical protein
LPPVPEPLVSANTLELSFICTMGALIVMSPAFPWLLVVAVTLLLFWKVILVGLVIEILPAGSLLCVAVLIVVWSKVRLPIVLAIATSPDMPLLPTSKVIDPVKGASKLTSWLVLIRTLLIARSPNPSIFTAPACPVEDCVKISKLLIWFLATSLISPPALLDPSFDIDVANKKRLSDAVVIMLPLGAVKEIAPALPTLPLVELVNEYEADLLKEILPLAVKKEIAPPFPALPTFVLEYAKEPELVSEILPLEVKKEIAPPFPVLLDDDCE